MIGRRFHERLSELILYDIIPFEFSVQMGTVLECLPNLVTLGVVKSFVHDIKYFPRLGQLRNLILDMNCLQSKHLRMIEMGEQLESLSLVDNIVYMGIEPDAEMEGIYEMQNLKVLNLSLNPGVVEMSAMQYKQYQRRCFQRLPQLQFLDNFARDGKKQMTKKETKYVAHSQKEEQLILQTLVVLSPQDSEPDHKKKSVPALDPKRELINDIV